MTEPLNRYAYLGDHKAVTVTRAGHRLLIDTRNVQNLSIVTHGEFERKTMWAIDRLVEEGQVVVDVGANIGFFTLQLCAQVGPEGTVVAVEPNPHIFSLLQETLHINAFLRRCTPHQCAAFDQEVELELTWDDASHGGGRLVVGRDTKDEKNRATVSCRRLDDLLEGRRPHFIKIDAEGSEFHILRGAARTLRDSPDCIVLTEWSPRFVAARSEDLAGAIEFLRETFSHIYLLVRVGQVEPLTWNQLADLRLSNLLLANQPLESRLG